MARLSVGAAASVPAMLKHHAAALLWNTRRGARRFSRRHGGAGWIVLGSLILTLLAGAALRHQSAQADALQWRLTQRAATASAGPVAPAPAGDGAAGARARLRAFEQHLLAQQQIPFAVQQLLDLAQREGLTVQRGQYQPQIDQAGGFMRYRMTWPVKGPAASIQRFLQAALRQQKTLALQSIQFKRARIGVTDIEARIQWFMLAVAPPAAGAPAAGAPAAAEGAAP
ncbi:MAG: hypothetical protein V4754_07130 [Pseudomonadota bacterium]